MVGAGESQKVREEGHQVAQEGCWAAYDGSEGGVVEGIRDANECEYSRRMFAF